MIWEMRYKAVKVRWANCHLSRRAIDAYLKAVK
jgi:hypothetical protein